MASHISPAVRGTCPPPPYGSSCALSPAGVSDTTTHGCCGAEQEAAIETSHNTDGMMTPSKRGRSEVEGGDAEDMMVTRFRASRTGRWSDDTVNKSRSVPKTNFKISNFMLDCFNGGESPIGVDLRMASAMLAKHTRVLAPNLSAQQAAKRGGLKLAWMWWLLSLMLEAIQQRDALSWQAVLEASTRVERMLVAADSAKYTSGASCKSAAQTSLNGADCQSISKAMRHISRHLDATRTPIVYDSLTRMHNQSLGQHSGPQRLDPHGARVMFLLALESIPLWINSIPVQARTADGTLINSHSKSGSLPCTSSSIIQEWDNSKFLGAQRLHPLVCNLKTDVPEVDAKRKVEEELYGVDLCHEEVSSSTRDSPIAWATRPQVSPYRNSGSYPAPNHPNVASCDSPTYPGVTYNGVTQSTDQREAFVRHAASGLQTAVKDRDARVPVGWAPHVHSTKRATIGSGTPFAAQPPPPATEKPPPSVRMSSRMSSLMCELQEFLNS